jgi:hypothetical protein
MFSKPRIPATPLESQTNHPLQTKSHFISDVVKFPKSDYSFRHVCPSLRPHGTTRLPLDRLLNLILEYFFENEWKKFNFITI